jgi:hypothetical protein
MRLPLLELSSIVTGKEKYEHVWTLYVKLFLVCAKCNTAENQAAMQNVENNNDLYHDIDVRERIM